jgi:hypothetical protein
MEMEMEMGCMYKEGEMDGKGRQWLGREVVA